MIRYYDFATTPFAAIYTDVVTDVSNVIYKDGTIESGDHIIVTHEGEPVKAYHVKVAADQPEWLMPGFTAFEHHQVTVGSVLNPNYPQEVEAKKARIRLVTDSLVKVLNEAVEQGGV